MCGRFTLTADRQGIADRFGSSPPAEAATATPRYNIAGVKQPVRILLKSREPFGFAGLWDQWMSPAGAAVNSCTIVTVIV